MKNINDNVKITGFGTGSNTTFQVNDANSDILFSVKDNGNVQFSGSLIIGATSGTLGQVLISQGPTVSPIWATAGGSGWSLTGNADTVDGVNFLGKSNS